MKNLSFSIFVYISILGFIVVFISGCPKEFEKPPPQKTSIINLEVDPTMEEEIIERREYGQPVEKTSSQTKKEKYENWKKEGRGSSWTRHNETERAEEGGNKEERRNGQKYQLFVDAIPPDSKIRIMNIRPEYKPYILLKPGRYDIEVSKSGYKTNRQWITIEYENFHLEVELVKR